MIRSTMKVIHRTRETLMAVFLGTMAYLNVSPDSQHGFLHDVFELSEFGHIVLSAVSIAFFIGSLVFAIWKNRRLFKYAFAKALKDRAGIGK